MTYFFMVAAICLLYILLHRYNKKYFIISSFTLLFLFEAFRKYDLWGDLVGYYTKHVQIAFFENLQSFNIGYLMDQKDVGYYFMEWIAVRMGISFQWWLAIIAFVFLFATASLIYKKSENSLISVLLFLALGFFSFSLSGLRQTVAMSIVIWAYFQLDKNHKGRFMVLVLIAALFHKSALVVLFLVLLRKKRFGSLHIMLGLAGLLGFTVFNSQVRTFLNQFVFTDHYSGYQNTTATLNFTGFFIQCAIFIFCLYYYKRLVKKHENSLILYNALFLGLIFQLYSSLVAEMFRVSMYFSICSLILVPMALCQEEDRRQRRVIALIIVSALLFYTVISGGIPYDVFWN